MEITTCYAFSTVRLSRQNVGIAILAASLVYDALFLSGWFHPAALRMRAHGGAERAAAIVLGSLSFKAVLLVAGALLAFWPARTK